VLHRVKLFVIRRRYSDPAWHIVNAAHADQFGTYMAHLLDRITSSGSLLRRTHSKMPGAMQDDEQVVHVQWTFLPVYKSSHNVASCGVVQLEMFIVTRTKASMYRAV